MSLDGRYRAVLDELDDWSAVVLVENERGDEVLDERRVDRDDLPTGVEEGAVMTASFENDALRHLVFEPAETERRRAELGERFDRLAKRPPGSNGDGDGAEERGDGTDESSGDAAGSDDPSGGAPGSDDPSGGATGSDNTSGGTAGSDESNGTDDPSGESNRDE